MKEHHSTGKTDVEKSTLTYSSIKDILKENYLLGIQAKPLRIWKEKKNQTEDNGIFKVLKDIKERSWTKHFISIQADL